MDENNKTTPNIQMPIDADLTTINDATDSLVDKKIDEPTPIISNTPVFMTTTSAEDMNTSESKPEPAKEVAPVETLAPTIKTEAEIPQPTPVVEEKIKIDNQDEAKKEIPVAVPTTISNEAPNQKTDPVDEKIERAKLAMEGPERTAKREEREHSTDVKNQLTILEKKLAVIAEEKETLEINWIKLDENRTGLRNMINPIVERETKLEADESQLEEQEKNTVNEKDRVTLEQKRWALQELRHKAEEEKWVYENRLFKIEDQIKDNTTRYQKFLDEEEKLFADKEELEKTV